MEPPDVAASGGSCEWPFCDCPPLCRRSCTVDSRLVPSGCFYCGNGRADSVLEGELRVSAIAMLGNRRGWVCADLAACERRRSAAKQLRLFGEAS